LCETGGSHAAHTAEKPAKEPTYVFTPTVEKPASQVAAGYEAAKAGYEKFSPIGNWVGSYICGQGYTGGTLSITQLRGANFEGVFHFYPTAKNLSVPDGKYAVYGQYDAASQRILINPGHWIVHPTNYYNTILVGSFDPIADTFSAYFQGINGCT